MFICSYYYFYKNIWLNCLHGLLPNWDHTKFEVLKNTHTHTQFYQLIPRPKSNTC